MKHVDMTTEAMFTEMLDVDLFCFFFLLFFFFLLLSLALEQILSFFCFFLSSSLEPAEFTRLQDMLKRNQVMQAMFTCVAA